MIKGKESLNVRLIKWFYGIPGPLDEYGRQQVDRIGSNAFIFLWLESFFSNLIIFWLTLNLSRTVLVLTIVANEIIGLLVTFSYVKIALAFRHLFTAEYDSKYAGHILRWTIVQGIKALLFYAPFIYYFNLLIACGLKHETLSIFLDTLDYPIQSLIYGLGFGIFVLLGQLNWVNYHR